MDLSIAKLKNSLMKTNLIIKSNEIKRILSQNVSRQKKSHGFQCKH